MQTIQYILQNCSHQVPACHRIKACEIAAALLLDTPYTALGGKQLRCNPNIVRFKLGKNWRLIYLKSAQGLVPLDLVSRQCFEHTLRRRRDS